MLGRGVTIAGISTHLLRLSLVLSWAGRQMGMMLSFIQHCMHLKDMGEAVITKTVKWLVVSECY